MDHEAKIELLQAITEVRLIQWKRTLFGIWYDVFCNTDDNYLELEFEESNDIYEIIKQINHKFSKVVT